MGEWKDKVEGSVKFHTARSTAFPQPAPGSAPSPTPLVVPEEKLRSVLGVAPLPFVGVEILPCRLLERYGFGLR